MEGGAKPNGGKTMKEPDFVFKKPFKTDGCSGGMSWAWRRFAGRPPPWEGYCVWHDHEYWRGGTRWDRLEADRDLAGSVRRIGHPVWAVLIYIGVRIGGSPLWPFPWRWDYGRPWRPFRGYTKGRTPGVM